MKCLPRISTSISLMLLTKLSRMIVQHPMTCDCEGIMSELIFPPIIILDVYHTLIDTCDLEGLGSKILKSSAPIIADTLNLHLQSLYTQIPKVFKIAKVIPVYKHSAKTDTSNYRSVSVLSLLSKPVEKHIHKHMLRHLHDNKLLHSNQSDLRQNHSCQTALSPAR